MTRFIILLRHGIAEDRTPDKADEDRRLTETGKRRMKQIGRTLARLFPEAEAIYSSPLRRAIETSEAVGRAYGGSLAIQKTDGLRPPASTADFRRLLAEGKTSSAIFVGHEPNLTEIMRDLTGMGAGVEIELKKGGCYGVAIDDDRARLEWMLPPRVLRARD